MGKGGVLPNIHTIRNGINDIPRRKGVTVGSVCWSSCEWWNTNILSKSLPSPKNSTTLFLLMRVWDLGTTLATIVSSENYIWCWCKKYCILHCYTAH